MNFSASTSFASTSVLIALLAGADTRAETLSPGGEPFTQISTEIAPEVSTGLEWQTHDNDNEINWHAAEQHCRRHPRSGGSEWRLPTIDELAGLYDLEASTPCGAAICHISAPIQLTSAYLWSASPENSDRRFYFDFRFGTRLAPRLRPELTRRALCVRSKRVD